MSDPVFGGWDNFHFLLGSAAAALIGLLFLVATLTSGLHNDPARTARGMVFYLTPTAMHFAVVLTTSAVAMAPRFAVWVKAVLFLLCALVGLANAVRACVGIRTPHGGDGPFDWSDFALYGVVPAAIYLALAVASVAIYVRAGWAVQLSAAAMLALLLIGIRNAWDLVTWMAPKARGGGGGGGSGGDGT
jgi:hypothetical protein